MAMKRVPCEVKVITDPRTGKDMVEVTYLRCDLCVKQLIARNEMAAINSTFSQLRAECPKDEKNYYYDGDD